MKENKYQICTNCIMDTSDSKITFDEKGLCDYCRNFYKSILPNWHPNEDGEKLIKPLINKIKEHGKQHDHDCLIGISGGVDSSYVAYIAKEKFGLRPLLFHVDGGWNTQISANNIQRIVDGLNLDLYTEVVNWEEMKDLQLAFFKAQVPDVDVPQDCAYFSALYNFASKNKFKYILTGSNFSTECVREPIEWGSYYIDTRFIKDIQGRFGTIKLKTFPLADIFKYKFYYQFLRGQTVVKPLNYVSYIRKKAIKTLTDRFGWQEYKHKHHESRFTRFYECYWLPQKFGFDKRRAHFSSLILTKQMTREEALERISTPEIDEETMAQDFEYVAKKLDLSIEELRKLFESENKSYKDYNNKMFFINLGTTVLRLFRIQEVIIR